MPSTTAYEANSVRDAIHALGSLSPRMSHTTALKTVCAADVDDVVNELLQQGSCMRVVGLVGAVDPDRADRLSAAEPLLARLSRIEKVTAGIDDCLGMLHELGLSLGMTIYGVKGVASRRWYTSASQRELGDVDVMVRHADEAWAMTAALLDIGYDYDERELPWLKRDAKDGTVYGQINLRFNPAGERPNIDVHFGGYSVRHCGRLPVAERHDEPGLAYYTKTENLNLVVGNAAGDHWVTTKDLNDLYLCLDDPEVDWDRVVADLGSVALLPFFGEMLLQLRARLDLDGTRSRRVDDLRAQAGREFPRPGTEKNWRRRLLATCRHAAVIGMRQSPMRAAVTAWTAARYYRRPLTLEVVGQGAPTRLAALNGWTCVLLVPTRVLEANGVAAATPAPEPALLRDLIPDAAWQDGRLTALRLAQGDIVRSARTIFVPTVYCRVGQQHAAAAIAFAHASGR